MPTDQRGTRARMPSLSWTRLVSEERPDLVRRRIALGLGAVAVSPLAALMGNNPAVAQGKGDPDGLRGTQSEGTIAPINIAIPRFLGDDSRFASEVTGVIL